MVERLRKASPSDSRGPKLLEEMRRRLAQAEKSGKPEPPPWASPPAHTALGFPVDWLAGFSRIVLDDAVDRSLLAAHPGCFCAACGLAIQGLGQAHVQLGLPLIGPSAIEKVAGVFRSTASAAWGIDVGSSCVKAVKLAWRKKEKAVVLEAAARVEYKKPLGQAANEEEEQSIVEEALVALVAQHPLKADKVCLGLPGRIVLMRLFEIPRTDRAKMSSMVRFEAKRHIPARLEDLAWDFQPLGGEEDGDDAARTVEKRGTLPVLFAAARWNSLKRVLKLMRCAGHPRSPGAERMRRLAQLLDVRARGGTRARQTQPASQAQGPQGGGANASGHSAPVARRPG